MSVVNRLRDAGFEVYTRAEWGSAAERAGAYARRLRTHGVGENLPYHYLHITVTSDTDTVQQGAAGARQVEGYGYSSPPMVSYQMLVTNEARIYQGQNYGAKGTHTVNDKRVPGFPEDLNRQGHAVAIMQNVGDEVTDEQVEAVAACYAAAELEGHVRRGAPIYPHRKFAWKACPGDKAVDRLDEIEKRKNQLVRVGLNSKEIDMAWNEMFGKWRPGKDFGNRKLSAGRQLQEARGYAQEATSQAKSANVRAARLENAFRAFAAAQGDTVRAAVEDALTDTVIDVNVVVSGADVDDEA